MIEELFQIIQDRKAVQPQDSYTSFLLQEGKEAILKKIGEETVEVILAATGEGKQRVVEETADLFYHSLVLLSAMDLTLEDVQDELRKRHIEKG
jgi:phosphoribosyl-ATP pyrophosphohydrolase